MSNRNGRARVALAGLVVALAVVAGCGGGGGGGGAPTFLTLSGSVNYWIGATQVFPPQAPVNPTPYPTVPLNGVPVPAGATGAAAYNVAAPVFAERNPGQQTFIELNFNTQVKASSIMSTPSSGSDWHRRLLPRRFDSRQCRQLSVRARRAGVRRSRRRGCARRVERGRER
jgi:hypothetical protein